MIAEATKSSKSVIPLSGNTGLPPETVVIEDASLALYDLNGDAEPDISHDRTNGRTVILRKLHEPSVPKTVMRQGATFHHRQTPEGTEVNAELDLDRFASAARNTITREQEERAEVSHSAALIGYCSLGSECSRLDWNQAGRL